MKKTKKARRILAAALAAAMLVGLSACQNDQTTSSNSVSQTDEISSGQADGNTVSTDPVTLTIFSMQGTSTTYGVEENWVFNDLKEKTGISLDWQTAAGNANDVMNTMLAGGELPDIVGFNGIEFAQQAMGGNWLLNLDDYQDLMPNLFEEPLYQDMIDYSRKYYSTDNKLHLLATAVGIDSTSDVNWLPQLMYQPYKAAGSPKVTTLEDYLDVVEAMVAARPTTENGEKVYGFTLFSDWDNYDASQAAGLSYFYGINCGNPFTELNMITQEASSTLDDDSFYKRCLQFYFEANQRGLLDPDSMTQTFDMATQKFSAGRVMFTYYSWMTGTYNDVSAGHVTPTDGSEPDGFYAVLGEDMKFYDAPNKTIGNNKYYAADSHSEYPERCAQMLDWLYSKDAQFLMLNGPEGLCWDTDEDGKFYITEEGQTYLDDTKKELPGGGTFRCGLDRFNNVPLGEALVDPETEQSMCWRYWDSTLEKKPNDLKQIWRDNHEGAVNSYRYMTDKDMLAHATQAVNMINPVTGDLQLTVSQIGDKVKTYSWQMIYAKDQAEFDSIWEKMVSEAKALGLEEVNQYFYDQWENALEIAKEYDA